MFLAFPSFDVWIFKGFPFFVWIFMIPLFIYVKDKPLKQVYISAFLAGALGHLLALHWIGFFGGDAAGYAVITAFLMPTLSVFFALKVFLGEVVSRRMPSLRFIVYPVMWCFVDWIQSLGYLAFPWINVAHAMYPITTFVQAASAVGVPGLNFIIILTSYSLSQAAGDYIGSMRSGGVKRPFVEWMNEPVFKRTAFIIMLVLIMNLWGLATLLNAPKPEKQDLRIAAVQTCIDPWNNWDIYSMQYLKALEKYSDDVLTANPDILIWSEASTLEPITYSFKKDKFNPFVTEILRYVKQIGLPLFVAEIGAAERKESGRTIYMPQNSCVIINEEGVPSQFYSKIHLVPFGEWFPYAKVPVIGEFINNLAAGMGGSDFLPGDGPKLMYVKGRTLAPLICYEGMFYRLCRKYRQMGAEFFINITNDFWSFSWSGHMQHFAASVFRAAENGVWLVRVGNSGLSAVIDPYGRVTATMPILEKGGFYGDIDFDINRNTVYTSAGGYIQGALVVAAFAFMLAAAILFVKSLRRYRHADKEISQ